MSPHDAFAQLRARLVGRVVAHKRLFLYTLQLYLEPDAGAARGPEIWCEPAWQLVGAAGAVAGSGAIEFDPDAPDPDTRARAVSEAAEVVCGLRVDDIELAPGTCELTIRLGPDWTLRTFVADPTEPEQWLLWDPPAGLRLRGGPNVMSVEAEQAG